MARVTEHSEGRDGRVRIRSGTLPRGMRGIDPAWDVHTFTEGPISRLLNRKRR